MRKYRTLIVDDEPSAREGVRGLLSADPELVVVGECGNGADAAAAILDEAPDIVLLDIEMPELDGFGCIELLDPAARPEIVFITAHEEYALKAFAAAAADYLLKPFSEARLREAMDRAKTRVCVRGRAGRTLTRLVAHRAGALHVIPLDSIDWIEGADYYVRVHCGATSHLIRQPLARLLTQLDDAAFIRVHRSVIVNVARIQEVLPNADLAVVLTTGKRLPLSRRLRPRVEAFLRKGV